LDIGEILNPPEEAKHHFQQGRFDHSISILKLFFSENISSREGWRICPLFGLFRKRSNGIDMRWILLEYGTIGFEFATVSFLATNPSESAGIVCIGDQGFTTEH
jgi:hypothetical protein